MIKFLPLLLVLFCTAVFSQNFVEGMILTDKGEPLPFANIALMSGTEIVAASTSNFDGYFKVQTKNEGMFHLEVSYVGFQNKVSEEFLLSDEIPLTKNFELERGVAIGMVTMCSFKPNIHYSGCTRTGCYFIGCSGLPVALRMNDTTELTEEEPLKKAEKTLGFSVYPNPSKGLNVNLFIKNSELNKNNILNVFNISGQLIYSKQFQQIEEEKQLHLNDIIEVPGNYFVKINNGQSSVTKKLVIQN